MEDKSVLRRELKFKSSSLIKEAQINRKEESRGKMEENKTQPAISRDR
jgi:hypothetical protein